MVFSKSKGFYLLGIHHIEDSDRWIATTMNDPDVAPIRNDCGESPPSFLVYWS